MSRLIHTDGPGKRRSQLMRTGAELLRRLSQKRDVDNEAKDILALLVFTLREIAQGIDESTVAWEKRNYWFKIEEFRNNWHWAGQMAGELEAMLIAGDWANLPVAIAKLLPHFSDIKVMKYTRRQSLWQGCYETLLAEH